MDTLTILYKAAPIGAILLAIIAFFLRWRDRKKAKKEILETNKKIYMFLDNLQDFRWKLIDFANMADRSVQTPSERKVTIAELQDNARELRKQLGRTFEKMKLLESDVIDKFNLSAAARMALEEKEEIFKTKKERKRAI